MSRWLHEVERVRARVRHGGKLDETTAPGSKPGAKPATPAKPPAKPGKAPNPLELAPR